MESADAMGEIMFHFSNVLLKLPEVTQWTEGNGLSDPGCPGVVSVDVMITTSFQRLPNVECNHHKAKQYV